MNASPLPLSWQLVSWRLALISVGLVCLPGCPQGVKTKPVELIVSGDSAGWIVPCGCTSNQSGGLLRRGTLVKNLREQHEVLLVDAGGAASGSTPYDLAKLAAILAGQKEMGCVAQNIGAAEARLGGEQLHKLRSEGAPLLSCNLVDANDALIAAPAIIATAGGQRIAFVGVLSPKFAADVKPLRLQITSPQEAVLKTLADQRGQFDRAIVLAYLPEDELQELAASLPEVDAVIGGPTGQSVAPRLVGPTLVAAATNKGKFVARITLPARTSKSTLTGEIIELNEEFKNDPQQEANLKQFYTALEKADFTPDQTPFAPQIPSDPPAGFRVAGSAACRDCHADEYAAWEKSTHAHAWQSLEKTGAHVDADCQRCHTTGYGLPGGFRSAGQSLNLVNVGCESCHGPSQAHVDQPTVHTALFGQAAGECAKCHDRENSPQFDFATYWSRIAHGDKP